MKRLHTILLIFAIAFIGLACSQNEDPVDDTSPALDHQRFTAIAAGYISGSKEEIINEEYWQEGSEEIFSIQLTKSNTHTLLSFKNDVASLLNEFDNVDYHKHWKTYYSDGHEVHAVSIRAKNAQIMLSSKTNVYIEDAIVIAIYWPDRLEFLSSYPRNVNS